MSWTEYDANTEWELKPYMWQRKNCCVCRNSFGVHPNAKFFETRQMCLPCRKAWAKELKTEDFPPR